MLKPCTLPLQVVVGLRRGQIFWSRRQNKIFTGVTPRPITTNVRRNWQSVLEDAGQLKLFYWNFRTFTETLEHLLKLLQHFTEKTKSFVGTACVVQPKDRRTMMWMEGVGWLGGRPTCEGTTARNKCQESLVSCNCRAWIEATCCSPRREIRAPKCRGTSAGAADGGHRPQRAHAKRPDMLFQ